MGTPWQPHQVFPAKPMADHVRMIANELNLDQLRELIGNIIEHVEKAEDVAIAFVEQREGSKLLKKLSMRGPKAERPRVCACIPAIIIAQSESMATAVVASVPGPGEVKGKINGHVFKSHTYLTPTFCTHCRKLLKGILKQV